MRANVRFLPARPSAGVAVKVSYRSNLAVPGEGRDGLDTALWRPWRRPHVRPRRWSCGGTCQPRSLPLDRPAQDQPL